MKRAFGCMEAFLLILWVLVVFGFMRSTTEAAPAFPADRALEECKATQCQSIPELPEKEAALFPWANKIADCIVTYYDVCEACCGKTDGITYTGAPAVPYETCAVDPDIIPLGSAVLIDYGDGNLHCYRAEDIGGAVRGAHIDVCVASHEEAVALGVQTADVYWTPCG